MAECDLCEKEMKNANGCLQRDYVIDGKRVSALEYHDKFLFTDNEQRCVDCNVKEGEPHHMGCDQEQCPTCGLQFIACDCDIAEQMFIFPKGRKPKI